MTAPVRGDAPVARFGGWAVTFEREPVSRLLVELQRHAFGLLEVTPEDRVLDVGCGTAAALRDALPAGASAVALDVTHPMLVRARQLAGGPPPHLVCADGSALPDATGGSSSSTSVKSEAALAARKKEPVWNWLSWPSPACPLAALPGVRQKEF